MIATGAYGAGLTRALGEIGIDAVEYDRLDRSMRRRQCKSDLTDAVSAARAELTGHARSLQC